MIRSIARVLLTAMVVLFVLGMIQFCNELQHMQ